MSYPSSRVLVYDHLSLVSLRLRGTRSRNKRACLLRFESADLSYLSLRRTPVVGALAPASSGLKDPVPGALSPHAPRCGARTGFPTGARETHLHRSPVVADLASPRRSTPPARRKGVIGRVVGWGCLLVIFRGGKIRGLIRSGSQDPEIRSIGKRGVAFALFPLPGAFFCRFGPVSSCLLWNTRR